MEERWIYSSLLALFLILVLKTLVQKIKGRALNLPPSPPALPFIGHLHIMKQPVHKTLQRISQKYGPVVYLQFGVQPVVIVSSPSVVEECFTKNDIILANRPQLLMGKHLAYNFTTMVSAPYGEHWRNLRRISSLEMLSPNCLSMSIGIRRDEVMQLLKKLYENSSQNYAKVELKKVFRNLVFNMVLRMLAGKRYYGENVVDLEEALRFNDIITEILEFASTSHPVDFLPVLRWVDYGGYVKRIKRLEKKMDAFLQRLVDEHRSGLSNVEDKETIIDRLLSLQESEPGYYTDETIKGLILVLLVAGTETSSTAMEWAMSLLLNHPNVLNKAKSEIDNQVGEDLLINELDLPKLQFLQHIISEALRLFPSAPLLLPHMSSQDCQIAGFDIPCGTILLVNAWAIHRDPSMWKEPTEFNPDRFQNTDIDQYKLLPFGSGRRGCPGVTLGNRMLGLTLGSLIQCFEWQRLSDKEIDMTEGRGITMPKAVPLEAMCKARPIMTKIL